MKGARVVSVVVCLLGVAMLLGGCGRQEVEARAPRSLAAGSDWAQVSCGGMHTAAVAKDGTLWTWGGNEWGQLGLGFYGGYRDSPTRVGTANDWASVSCGWDHTVAVKQDGTLWAWGNDDSGQLGVGDSRARDVPTRVGSTDDWATVSCGWDQTGAVKKDGTLWAWGSNRWGQLGLGYAGGEQTSPAEVGAAADWATVSCGGQHTAALKKDGSLWSWGANGSGQLGDGTVRGRATPKRIGSATDWAAVSCGGLHTAAIREDGSLWVWGDNQSGQLGLGDVRDRMAPAQLGDDRTWAGVSCGGLHTCAVKRDGTLWAWGYDQGGQLGLGGTRPKSLLAGTVYVVARPAKVGGVRDWASVSCGTGHTAALTTDGMLWAWGNDHQGELGLGGAASGASPG